MRSAGLTTRLVLVAVGMVALVVAVATIWMFHDRSATARGLGRAKMVDRMVATQQLLDTMPASAHRMVLRAVSGPLMLVKLVDVLAEHPASDRPFDRRMERTMRQHPSGAFAERDLNFAIVDREPEEGDQGAPDLLPSFRRFEVSIRQADGRWLVFVIPADNLSWLWVTRGAATIIAVVLLVTLLAWIVTRKITRPITALARAADQFAAGTPAEPLEESGPPEIQRATVAFNRMRDRIGELLAERTRMLAAIAHDLRTPLTRLRLRLEDLPDDTARAKAKSDLQAMETMLNETLAYARDVAGAEPVTELDLAALLRTAVDDMTDAGRNASYAGPDRLVVRGRPTALRRAIDNVLTNALTYGGSAEASLTAIRTGARITVADRGPGIPPDMQERVFEPFFRVETSRSRQTGGTGLGLALARGIVRAHGGDVTIHDRPGGGTLVAITVPS